MKANKVKSLLRKAAKKNEFTIDEITGTVSGEVDVFGIDAYGNDILITAYRNRKGKIEELLAELVAALQANDPDNFKRWLCGGIQDLGEAAVSELLLDWIDPFITRVERDRMVAWHLGVSL